MWIAEIYNNMENYLPLFALKRLINLTPLLKIYQNGFGDTNAIKAIKNIKQQTGDIISIFVLHKC